MVTDASKASDFVVGTGQMKYRRLGWIVLKWTLLAAFGFFAVLIAERVA